MSRSTHYYVRKSHRFLGLLLGIQFLLWTAGGLYFSWSNMQEIRGDVNRKQPSWLSPDISVVSPSIVLQSLKKRRKVDSVLSVRLLDVLGKPTWQIRTGVYHEHLNGTRKLYQYAHLADAETGELRGPLTREEAIVLATQQFSPAAKVKNVQYFTTVPADHEYRENTLPAYAIELDHPSLTRVYVAAEMGEVTKFRNDKWRVFDFLWMLHTMDYQSRDHFGNILLRIFSVFGLITILSGFLLFYYSSRSKNKRRYR